MFIRNTTLLLFLIFLMASCERVVDIPLNIATPRLVIEGNLEARGLESDSSFQQLFLRLSGDFYEPQITPVSNAVVSVLTPDGTEVFYVYQPRDSSYITNSLTPKSGKVYTLKILYQGEEYRVSDTVSAIIPIDSLYFGFQKETAFGDAGIVSLVDFKDPIQSENYYWFRLFRNDSSTFRVDPGNRFRALLRDQFINGQVIRGLPPADNEAFFQVGDKAELKLSNISKRQYEFLTTLYRSSPPGAFDPPPAPIRSNVSNVTNPSNAPLGFFGFIGVSRRIQTVPDSVQNLP
ncbi:MAG: DUF4249 domain-containing protein [Chloroherpetonaceae bacterium]|nr:DUF4249 domain-containing protein [Chloroherpetonaceae bacterium]